jgi:hypothetical protein
MSALGLSVTAFGALNGYNKEKKRPFDTSFVLSFFGIASPLILLRIVGGVSAATPRVIPTLGQLAGGTFIIPGMLFCLGHHIGKAVGKTFPNELPSFKLLNNNLE